MNKKKILWILLLIAVIGIVVALIMVANKKSNDNASINSTDNITSFNKDTNAINEINESEEEDSGIEYAKIELSDGILYSIDGKEYKPDIVVGDNYYDTTINDMYLNPDNYMNKNIEIEGMYLENEPYMFVGRYSTSNICVYCPVGYSYMEYQLDGTIDRIFTKEQDWIKVIGTLEKGNDASTDFQDYYYLKVLNLEVMNEKGLDTVNN